MVVGFCPLIKNVEMCKKYLKLRFKSLLKPLDAEISPPYSDFENILFE